MMRRNDREIKPKPCLICMHCIKWIPVLFIFAVICWSYYAYIYELCILTVNSILLKILFIILYHFVLFLFLWAYWKTIFTPVATVPAKWRIPQAEIDKLMQAESQDQQKRILEYLAKDLPVCNRTMNGAVRFCDKCIIIKPDRAHHCSVCGVCVLKMDHHCPWVNNCVNFANYKYFVLFLAYALLYCIYVALTSLEYFVQFWQGGLNTGGNMGKFHILFLFFISVMFAISLVSLFGYHIYLVLFNRTTLEAFRAPIFRFGGPDKNGYNLGKMANFQEVFGDNWKMWFFPVNTSLGNGLQYRMQSPQQQQCATYESMGDTPTRLDDSSTSTDKFLNNFTATTTTNITVVPSTATNTNNTIHNNSTIHCSNNTVSNNIHTNSSSLINNIDDNNDYDNITKSTIVIDIEQEPLQSSNSTTRPQLIQNHQQEYINSNIIVDNPSGGNLLINSNNDEQKIITNNLNNVVVDLELQQNQQQSASIVNV